MLTPLVSGEPSTVDVLEKTTPRYSFRITDDQGTGIVPASFVLSLFCVQPDGTVAIVNARSVQNVLNANGVTVDAQGRGAWSIAQADTALLDPDLPFETHIAQFIWTWGSGGRGTHELHLVVRNLRQVG